MEIRWVEKSGISGKIKHNIAPINRFINRYNFRWSDISNVINHKRDFIIETVVGSEKVQFQFGDVESAKNAWRFCVLQHVFFRQYEMVNNSEKNDKAPVPPPIFQQNEVKIELNTFVSKYLFDNCELMFYRYTIWRFLILK